MRRAFLTLLVTGVGAAVAHAGAADYFAETSKDFGTSPRGPVLTHYFPVKNTTGQPITLGTPRVSCGCVSAQTLKSVLAPGESTAVVAMMDTRRIPVAGVTRTVTVFVPVQTGFSSEEIQLRVSAIARDDLVLTSDTFAFGTVRKGQGGKATTKITFYSDPNWQITEARSTGIYVKAAAVALPKAGTESAFEVTATLDPACPVGNWTADVWLKTSAPGVDRLRIPVTVNVVAPIDIKPDALAFGAVTAGQPADLKVVLQGSQAFKVLSAKGLSPQVTVSAAGPAARPVHILTVTLTAAAAGKVATAVEITTDHPDMPKVTVPVSATAAKPEAGAATAGATKDKPPADKDDLE